MNATFIATGSELLDFKINKYTPLFSQKLNKLGIKLKYEITSRDNLDDLIKSVNFAILNSDLIIICGGLGPTFDDHTRNVISKITGKKLVFSKEIEKAFKKRYQKPLKPNILDQCMILEGSKYIENTNGTAPGEIIEYDKKSIILLPGPQSEWEGMWKDIEKYLIKKINNPIITYRFKVAEIKEVELENLLNPVMKKFKLDYTILAGPNICEFIIRGEKKNRDIVYRAKKEIEEILSEKLYGYDDDTLEKVIGNLLSIKGKTLSIAESCTGGLVSNLITNIPGSSRYYLGGINAYSNFIKRKILGVKENTLKKFGAVSAQTAKEMALNCKNIFNSDISISITGIAGPDGGSKEKPVGLVYFAIAIGNKVKVEKRIFIKKDRIFIKTAAANTSLYLALNIIKSNK
jgi:nicotinamide-nucleotide amidase